MNSPTVRFKSIWFWATFLAAGAAQYFHSPGLVWLALMFLVAYGRESEDEIHAGYYEKISVLERKLEEATRRGDVALHDLTHHQRDP